MFIIEKVNIFNECLLLCCKMCGAQPHQIPNSGLTGAIADFSQHTVNSFTMRKKCSLTRFIRRFVDPVDEKSCRHEKRLQHVVLSCKYCKIFKKSFFIGHLPWLLLA